MTIRTPPTEADIRGETERGREAYNQRRRDLRDRGIATIPDLYDDDALDDMNDPSGAIRFWRRHAAETAANVAQEREWGRQDEHANGRSPKGN